MTSRRPPLRRSRVPTARMRTTSSRMWVARASSAPDSNRHTTSSLRGSVGVGAAGERVRGGDVLGAAREADHEPVAGRLAQLGLDRGDRAERRVDLRVGLAHGRAEHVGVLAHLERCEVEPERAHLFGEVGQLPVGQDRRAAGAERRTKGLQVSLEGIDGSVPRGRSGAGRGEPLGDQHELAPVRRVRQRPRELTGALGERADVAGERPAQRIRGRHVGLGGRERPGDPSRRGLVAAQDVVTSDRGRAEGDLRGHGGVAVSIAAHPGAPAERRRCSGGAGDLRQRREDRPVEQRHRRAHLVERLRRPPADRIGQPQARDLLAQPPFGLAVHPAAGAWVVQRVEQVADPPEVLDHGAALGLRGMGGEHLGHLDRPCAEAGAAPVRARGAHGPAGAPRRR